MTDVSTSNVQDAPAPAPVESAWQAIPPGIWLCILWLGLMVVVAIGADVLAPYVITRMDLVSRLAPPALFGGSAEHLLGTDELGRDILSRLLSAIRISLLVALLATLVGAIIGTALGMLAAHFRGIVDDAVMVLVDAQASMPFLVIALAMLAFFGNSLVLFILVIGLYGWERYARIVRGLAMAAKQQGYANAVRQLGASGWRINVIHILPNVASALVVNVTLCFPDIILLETGLSFLGLGIQPPMASLGNMVGAGRDYLGSAWWITAFPGVAIVVTTLCVSLLGDWLRDRLDPTLR
jgi:peptide/nickel transport system permease protein